MDKYDSDNIFYKFLTKQLKTEVFYEDEVVLAFPDIAPAAPIHLLIIPKGEFTSFDDFAIQYPEMVGSFFNSVRKVAKIAGLSESGYRLITNHGKNASQTVPHFHIHLLGGKQLGGLLPEDPLLR